MKRIIYTILIILSISSCSTYTTLMITGEPGTEIADGNKKHLGSIDQTGELEIKIENDTYYPYLLSKSPNSNLYVPFALEFKENTIRYYLETASLGLGAGLALGGLTTILCGAIDVGISGDTEVFSTYGLVGGIMSLGSLAFLFPEAIVNDGVDYCYSYLKEQSTNNDIIKE